MLPLVALLGCATPAPRPAPAPVVTPAPPPAPPAAAPAPPAAVAPPPAAARPAAVLPATVRIGLRTDLDSVTLPCCEVPASAELAGAWRAVTGPVIVRPADGPAPLPVWRLQVAALREEDEAARLDGRLARLGVAPVDARFDAASGLYRVRAGAWPTREAAEGAGRALQGRGLASFWPVSEGAPLAEPALRVRVAGAEHVIAGRRFALRAAGGAGLFYEGHRYRGDLAVVLNDRGRLNLVNELPLEDYLRGVVPSELGPDSYPELEALKAQAVAARSYTLRNLGGFAEEGYDLCGTPKCQVYGGMGAEHPLSDRAVAATAGEVLLWDGEPIDALYSATCGGHTEDVEVVFPLKHAPYLRGVSCLEAGLATLAAPAGEGEWPRAGDGSLERRTAIFEALRAGDLLVHDGAGESGFHVGRDTLAYRDAGDGPRPAALALGAGDPLVLWLARGRLAAVVQELPAVAPAFDRPHARAAWTRFRSDREIADLVRPRLPGFEFASLDILARGPSGRVGRLLLRGADGSSVEVAGLAVRWTLDLPDTLFTVRRVVLRGGRRGWQFTGRGWGHGVGLCQYGAWGMSRRGLDYRAILAHYYSGAVLARLAPAAGAD